MFTHAYIAQKHRIIVQLQKELHRLQYTRRGTARKRFSDFQTEARARLLYEIQFQRTCIALAKKKLGLPHNEEMVAFCEQ